MLRREKGIVLTAVIIIAIILAIMGISILTLAEQEATQTRIETNKNKAFYLAEAGMAKLSETLNKPLLLGDLDTTLTGSIEGCSYRVVLDANSSPCYAISTGTSGTVQKTIRTQAILLAPPFDNAIFAMNNSGSNWVFQLRGTGNPVPYGMIPGAERGGKDIIRGNLFIDGDAYLYEQSSVNPAPAPNLWNLNGDVGATGTINVLGSASISGSRNSHAEEPALVDITTMDYAHNNTHDVALIFQSAGITSGYLPSGNPLRDVFVKNPSDRPSQCNSTTVDDYFFEPSSGFVTGGPKTGDTPLHAGNDRVYYVDGDVWVASNPTYGFKMDGKVTIVATGDVHVCDNLEYKDANSLLGLVALGQYNSSGHLTSGGNIYFGDPVWGNMSIFSAMMFAANDFLFNTDAITRRSAEPDSGFTVNGSFCAMGKVSIDRDWYTKGSGHTATARAARYDSTTGQWADSETGTVLTSTETGTLRHYQMIINYDDRVRNQMTQPPGLPRGNGRIFAGFSNWEEL